MDDNTLLGQTSNPPDDDTWLNFEPASFDEMLKNHFNLNDHNTASANNHESMKKEQAIPVELKNFLSSVSNFEGIDSLPTESRNSNQMNLDPEEFENVVNKMLSVKGKDDLSDLDSSEDEEYESTDLNQNTEDVHQEWKSC